jgi:hypothetical protein
MDLRDTHYEDLGRSWRTLASSNRIISIINPDSNYILASSGEFS